MVGRSIYIIHIELFREKHFSKGYCVIIFPARYTHILGTDACRIGTMSGSVTNQRSVMYSIDLIFVVHIFEALYAFRASTGEKLKGSQTHNLQIQCFIDTSMKCKNQLEDYLIKRQKFTLYVSQDLNIMCLNLYYTT